MWPAAPIPGQWAYVLGACVLLALAAAAWGCGWRYDRAKGRPRCHKCGYPVVPGNARDVTEAVARAAQSNRKAKGWTCPECGWVPRRVKDLTRTRRSRRWLAVSVLLVLGAVLAWYTIHVQYRRLTLGEPLTTAATPTTWWIAVLPYRDGNEDLIVYYRAYPQSHLSPKGTRQMQLNNSSRRITLPPQHYHGRDAGWMAIPRWQAAWGASRCRAVMHDTSRTESERADAVWLYAELSMLDERDEVEVLTTIEFQGQEDLVYAAFDQLYENEVATEVNAQFATAVIGDVQYSIDLRESATWILAECGVVAEPFVLELIQRGEPELDAYVYWTLAQMQNWYFDDLDEIDAYLLRTYAVLMQSRCPELVEVALMLILEANCRSWDTGDGMVEMYSTLSPLLEALVIHDDETIREDAVLLAGYLPEGLGDRLGDSDPRVIDAWAWCLSLPKWELRATAAWQLSQIAHRYSRASQEDGQARATIRSIVEARYRHELIPAVRRELKHTIEWLDRYDARAAEHDASRAAEQVVPAAPPAPADSPTPAP